VKKQSTPKAALATLEQFTIGGNLDVSDVLSVVVSKAETHYTSEIERCKAEAKTQGAANDKLGNEIKAQAKKEREAPFVETLADLNKALKPLGGSAKFSDPYCHGSVLNENKMLVMQININNSHSNYSKEVAPSKDLLKKMDQLAEGRVKVEKLQSEALDWKRKLVNVPMLERQYRAKIAEAKLGASNEGKQLLEMLTSGLDDAILALPSA